MHSDFPVVLETNPTNHNYDQKDSLTTLIAAIALTPSGKDPGNHVARIVALSDVHGVDATVRALTDALQFQAYSAQYIANLLEQRQRKPEAPSALQLTRSSDLLDIELPEPNLSLYHL